MSQPVIKVVDSIMGSGKSSAAINMINSDTENNYIYITPYLPEVERIKVDCSTRKFHEPKIFSKEGELYSKFDSLHELLKKNKNIVSTHALFRRSNEETKELIYSGNYVLILDEVMDVVEQLEMKKSDMQMLFDYGLLSVFDGYVIWNEDNPKAQEYDGRFNDLKQMALNRNLIMYKDTILMWTFPADIFKSFKEVYILTYMFSSQIQKYYYDMNNITYKEYEAVYLNDDYMFKEKRDKQTYKELKQDLKKKINIYQGSLNSIGDTDFTLSMSWYKKKKDVVIKLKYNTENYFKHKAKTSSALNMWTTFTEYKSKVKGNGYTKGFISCNARAVNKFKHKTSLAYLINRYANPIVLGFFEERGIKIDQDLYALSEMLQWVWRSAIREGKEINLYIPSKRMRTLFNSWLDDEI
ncbi:hypothetical protein [Brevibacillus laterosporus]|uniref:hypothetical protein n=1 Tax=Brevibacillus laterosporus TaxID=1465 RepID=UPI0018F86526|nr:hypothetical protein [Brevibacillus laterosporus]MBG9776178.1 hypothetical protein [Brevibacillus laterosporus]